MRYGEGIFVGYRYYDKKQVAPLFPFGFGLSYTSFAYDNLRLSAEEIAPDDRLEVSLDVTNTGQRAGKEIVQLYVRDVEASVARPPKELKGFAKVALEPGETTTVTLHLDREALAFWNEDRQEWVAEAGEFEVLVGSSSQDIRGQARFHLAKTTAFGGPAKRPTVLSIESTIRELVAHDDAYVVLEKHLPGFSGHPQLGMLMGMSLVQVSGFAPNRFPQKAVHAIANDLQALYGDGGNGSGGNGGAGNGHSGNGA